jgi:hypothetical protein
VSLSKEAVIELENNLHVKARPFTPFDVLVTVSMNPFRPPRNQNPGHIGDSSGSERERGIFQQKLTLEAEEREGQLHREIETKEYN